MQAWYMSWYAKFQPARSQVRRKYIFFISEVNLRGQCDLTAIPKNTNSISSSFYIIDYLAGLLKDGRIHYLLSLHNSGWPDDMRMYFCKQNKKCIIYQMPLGQPSRLQNERVAFSQQEKIHKIPQKVAHHCIIFPLFFFKIAFDS